MVISYEGIVTASSPSADVAIWGGIPSHAESVISP